MYEFLALVPNSNDKVDFLLFILATKSVLSLFLYEKKTENQKKIEENDLNNL